MKTTTLTSSCVAFAVLLMFGSTTQAASLPHVDQWAARVNRQANLIWRQTRQIPGNGPRLQHLRQIARNCVGISNRIHQLAHNRGASYNVGFNSWHARSRFISHGQGRFFAINRQLRLLDAEMHHMADDIRNLRADILARLPQGPRGSAHVSHRDHGDRLLPNRPASFVAGRLAALNRLQQTMRRFENTVHHLMEDTGFFRRGRDIAPGDVTTTPRQNPPNGARVGRNP